MVQEVFGIMCLTKFGMSSRDSGPLKNSSGVSNPLFS